jgi:hypothetical protein
MSNRQISSGGLSLLARWIAATSTGWAAGLGAGMLLTWVATWLPWMNEDRVFGYATLISLGLTLGLAQWVVLRRYISQPFRWVTATLIGYLLCVIIIISSNLAALGGMGVWNNVLLLGLLGTAIGMSQWWILRRHYRSAGWWVLATAAGFICFLWIILIPSHSLGELVIRGTLVGTTAALVSGITLVWLVRQPLVTA